VPNLERKPGAKAKKFSHERVRERPGKNSKRAGETVRQSLYGPRERHTTVKREKGASGQDGKSPEGRSQGKRSQVLDGPKWSRVQSSALLAQGGGKNKRCLRGAIRRENLVDWGGEERKVRRSSELGNGRDDNCHRKKGKKNCRIRSARTMGDCEVSRPRGGS